MEYIRQYILVDIIHDTDNFKSKLTEFMNNMNSFASIIPYECVVTKHIYPIINDDTDIKSSTLHLHQDNNTNGSNDINTTTNSNEKVHEKNSYYCVDTSRSITHKYNYIRTSNHSLPIGYHS